MTRSAARRRPFRLAIPIAVVVSALLVALPQASNDAGDLIALKRAVVANYSIVVHASYSDALDGARHLATAVDAFLASPAPETLQAARRAWIDARVPYAQTEAYRFYDGPIDAVDGLINAWPIDENLIDSPSTIFRSCSF